MSRIAGVYNDWSISFRDAGNEIGTMRGSAVVLDDVNMDAQLVLWSAFLSATEAITLGQVQSTVYCNTNVLNTTQPGNGAARETKLLVQYANLQTGKRHTLTVPTLDPTIPTYVQNINARDVVNVGAPPNILAFVNAFNAFVADPSVPLELYGDIAPAVQVVGLKVVGRNN